MSDIFREVDEEIRRDELKGMWDRYGLYVLGLCAAVILGVGGYKGWQAYQASRAYSAGENFAQALNLQQEGKNADALKQYAKIAADAPGGYAGLAKFQVAGAHAQAGDIDKAIKVYDELAADSAIGPNLQGLARIRAGFLLLDRGKSADIETRVAGLNVSGNAWQNSAREILALSAQNQGDLQKAQSLYDAIVADPLAPQGVRERAQIMQSLLGPEAAEAAKAKPAKPSN